MSDFLKEQELKEKILKSNQTTQEFSVYCPACAHEHCSTEVWESGLAPNGAPHEYECSACGKEFLITADVVFSTELK